MEKIVSTYDKTPFIDMPTDGKSIRQGWADICQLIQQEVDRIEGKRKIIVLDCYQGVMEEELVMNLVNHLKGTFYYSKDYMLAEESISKMIHPDVTDDEIFGYMTRLQMKDFFDPEKIKPLLSELEKSDNGVVYIYGPGASLLTKKHDLLVYFDMPRWEIQLRFRRNEVTNLGINNRFRQASLQYKQAFFVDWRVCDRHKKKLMGQWDYVVDTTHPNQPKIVPGKLLNDAFQQAVRQPFRVVPFFDPGPWGGQWLKEYCDLNRNEVNYAWGFDCVPEENSLLFRFNNIVFETPSINLVFAASRKLLGDAVQARFGDEFPIRFDFLDTIDGGNLSLQVHPSTEYIQEQFGMHYTQDESYYMLDAKPGAFVYLGLKNNIDSNAMLMALRASNEKGTDFDADKFVEKWPVKKHDHVLIPAGTVHCSGKDSMVLEISATPYIFTFKLWDWGRTGLDGKPRPINIEHGKEVIDWSRTPASTAKELLNIAEPLAQGEGWKEERTGLHEREFIETRRHWFSKTVHHHTNGSVNVLNLVEGEEAIIESPTSAFAPFIVHYAETFIVPEFVKEYTVRPYGKSEGRECATIKAFVRTHP